MSREGKLVKNTLILSIGTFLPKLAAFVTLPILTGYLTKEQYGTYDLIVVLVSLVLPVTTLQIHTAAFRFLIEHKNDRHMAKVYLSNILAFVIPVSVVTLTVLYFLLPVDSAPIKLWVCLYFFFDTVVTEVRQVARGMAKNLDYSISSIISAFIKMVLALLLVQMLKMELLGAVIALALSPLISLVYLMFKLKVHELIDFKSLDKSILKEMLQYSWPMVPNNMSMWVMRVSNRFVITTFMGLAANAVYSVANKMPSLLTLAQSTFTMAWQENASIVSKDNDVALYYTKMFKVMMNLYAGFLGLIIACTPILFALLVKGDYDEAYSHIPLLFLGMFFYCMASFLGGIYIALKKTKNVGITTFLAAVCNIVINLLLIRYIGLYAASISTLISYICLFVFRTVNIRKFVDIKYDGKHFLLILLILIVEAGLCFMNTTAVNAVNMVLGVAVFILLNREIVIGILSKMKKLVQRIKK